MNDRLANPTGPEARRLIDLKDYGLTDRSRYSRSVRAGKSVKLTRTLQTVKK